MFERPTTTTISGITAITATTITASAIMLALNGPAAAQQQRPVWQPPEGKVLIENKSEQERKVCIFRKPKIYVVPMACFNFKARDTNKYWTNTRREEFRLVTYRPRRGPDKKLRTQIMPADTSQVRINADDTLRVTAYVPPPPPLKEGQYYVNFCNMSQPGDVWLHIGGLPENGRAFAQGYFRIKPGDCTRINFSQAAQRIARVPLGTRIRPLYRAFAVDENGEISRTWRGNAENGDPRLCVNIAKSYKMRQTVDANLQTTNRCDRENQAKRLFLKGPKLKIGQNVGTGRVVF